MKKIQLTQDRYTIVDDSDYDLLSVFKWYYAARADYPEKGDARRQEDGKVIRMHRQLLDLTDPKIQVDHIDGDSLNNQRSNLRMCDTSQNMCNTKPYNNRRWKGVYKHNNKWKALLRSNGKIVYLGLYSTPEEAAKAYDVAALEYHGEFARINTYN